MTREDYLVTCRKKHARMVKDHENGMSLEDIRQKYNYATLGAVRYVLRKHGKDPETPGRWGDRPLDVPKVMALQRAGWQMDKIVEEFSNEYTAEEIRKAVREWRG